MISRRGFLGALSALAGAVLDPERLLWVPGRRVFFLPSAARPGWPSDAWVSDAEAKRMLAYYRSVESEFLLLSPRVPFVVPGEHIRVRIPQWFTGGF